MRDFTEPASLSRKIPNPFIDDVFTYGKEGNTGAPEVHQRVMSQCISVLETLIREGDDRHQWGSMGRCLLISAPRAGFGKSHLVGRLRSTTESIIAAVNLPFDPSRSISWPMVLASVLRQYSDTTCPQNRECSLMDETSRFFLASLVRASILSGSLSDKDCPESEASLRVDYRNIFSRNSKSKILNWVDKRSGELAHAASQPMKSRWGLGRAEVSFWTGVFVDYTKGYDDALEPLRGLSNGEARQRMLQFLRITSECRPITFIVDHLDGFHGSETAGMAIADILTSIRTEVTKCLTLLCINEDLWESVFEKRLPSAWIDRLTGEPARLSPLGKETARSLVLNRLESVGVSRNKSNEFFDLLSEELFGEGREGDLFPRDLIRRARKLWEISAADFYDGRNPVRTETPVQTAPKPTPESAFPFPPKKPVPPPIPTQPVTPTAIPTTEFVPPATTPRPQPSKTPFGTNPVYSRQKSTYPDRPSTPVPTDQLPGISSIIDDIRGSGNSVISESPQSETKEDPIPAQPFTAGSLTVKPSSPAERQCKEATLASQASPPSTATRTSTTNGHRAAPQGWSQDLEGRLRSIESQITGGGELIKLDLPRLEKFIAKVGGHHPALSQEEEHIASSRTVCLRWKIRETPVLIGFEAPRNVYFWNSLLQLCLTSSGDDKIAAFSHPSEPFNPQLFSGFGFSEEIVNSHIDIVEMNDKELGMIYAADRFLAEAESEGRGQEAYRLITRRLDPLWRRIGRPLS